VPTRMSKPLFMRISRDSRAFCLVDLWV
jgi:hypothetical protein